MHSIPPPRNFLVLSANSSKPFDPSKKFLVLSPTESGPDLGAYDEQALTDSLERASESEAGLHRSDSTSSSSSEGSRFDDAVNTLPGGFLFLGHPTRRSSQ
ncbi:uncharacterized protein N7469_010720 [Penicillium citrinum]|uniref:Uncharacterized protein n=1 Tax=Penicillium citrinum TaxID=5077 RepID=A0A9W9NLB4_PENCI|nr:uncharacterized protein N7469_010720 [Penicillium citrinum]KAJ5221833.1 hypothetical protein N7469_010720 [Penicillium citrinum]KAK5797644.1 hypothetical protein VI817_003935 [Penicillium citrinum]